MPLIKLVGVSKKYVLNKHEVEALRTINMKVDKGEFVVVLGPSGSGKSTLLHLIGTLDRPTQGEIFIDGQNVSKMKDRQASHFRLKTVGFVFQTFNLFFPLTAEENVALPLILSGLRRSKALKIARETLGLLGLWERARHKPSELSGGEAQRVAIARAIATKPPIILADEPTGNLDSKTGKSIMDILRQLNKMGHTVIMVTHEKSFAKYGTRTIHLLDGKIVADEKHS